MKKQLNYGLLMFAAALGFSLGFANIAAALPFDRADHYGYFLNKLDDQGVRVLRNGIYSRNAEQFISDVMGHYDDPCDPTCQNRTGAEFIIHTMIGSSVAERQGSSRVLTGAEIEEWKARVRSADRRGLVNWNEMFTYNFNTYYQDDHNDNGWYNESGASPAIVFYNTNGVPIYALRHECANPIVDSDGILPPAPQWTMEGESYIDGVDRGTNGNGTAYVTGRKLIYAFPGDSVNFFHFMRNRGPDRGSSRTIAWERYPGEPERFAPRMQGSPFYSNESPVVDLNPGQSMLMNWNGFRIPGDAEPGQRYCQFVSMYWHAYDDRTEHYERDKQSCAEVTYKYNLRPSVTPSDRDAVQGEEVTFRYDVTNDGPTRSRLTDWRAIEVIFGPGTSPGTLTGDDGRSCGYYFGRGADSCTMLDTGSEVFEDGGNEVDVNEAARVSGMDYEPGTRVCRILAVDPPTHRSSPRNRWSTASCVIVAKRPSVHFMGGDISVGNPYQQTTGSCALRSGTGGIYTVASDTDNGSVTEYAAFVRGLIQFQQSAGHGFGTGSRPAAASSAFEARLRMQQLGFANTADGGNGVGELGGDECMTDYYAKFSSQIQPRTNGGSPNISLSGMDDERLHFGGNRRIVSANIRDGASILIVVEGDVFIDDDITYQSSGGYGSVDDIPSVAIIAGGDIIINESVDRIDGILISKQTLHTCSDRSGALSSNDCNEQLTINGMVMTERLNLRRTFGAQKPNTDQPAELFNYGTELFFHNVLDDQSASLIDTVEQRDLPPRY